MKSREEITNKNFNVSGSYKTTRTWVLVVNERIARIFSKHGGELEIEDALIAYGDVLPEMNNDTVGRVASSSRSSVRHKYEPSMNESRQHEMKFVREISAWVRRLADEGAFDRLVLVAGPKMLGELRAAFDDKVQEHIVAEVNKDLAGHDEVVLKRELLKHIPGPQRE